MPDCLIDVAWNILNLEEAYEKDGLIIGQDIREDSGAKKFAVVRCVARYPSKAVGTSVESKHLPPRPSHMCDQEFLIQFLSETDRHWYEVLRVDDHLRLFFDLDWHSTDLHNIHTTPGVVIEQICNLLQEYVCGSLVFHRKCVFGM